MKSALLEASGVTGEILNTVSVNKQSLATYITPQQAQTNGNTNFTVVRHPLARALSAYKDLVLTRPGRGMRAGLSYQMSLDDYFLFLKHTDDSCDVHFRSMSWFIKNVDIVFKLEDNFKDWNFNFKQPSRIVHQSNKFAAKIKPWYVEIVSERYNNDFKYFDYDPWVYDYALDQ